MPHCSIPTAEVAVVPIFDIVTALAFFNENATLHFVVSLPNARTVILPIKKNRAFEHGL